MPKKPVKWGFKVCCCFCACCGYLCTFQVYQPTDPITGRKTPEKRLVMRVVSELVAPFAGLNHVVYCDNFYSSAPFVDKPAEDKILFAGTIKRSAMGFPDSPRKVHPPRGSYVSETVGSNTYCVFEDRKGVCFVTNVFPEHMDSQMATYGFDRKSERFWLKMFFQFLTMLLICIFALQTTVGRTELGLRIYLPFVWT